MTQKRIATFGEHGRKVRVFKDEGRYTVSSRSLGVTKSYSGDVYDKTGSAEQAMEAIGDSVGQAVKYLKTRKGRVAQSLRALDRKEKAG